MKFLSVVVKCALLTLIDTYRRTARWRAWLIPPMCRFYPSCSSYAHQAVDAHGVVFGLGYATWRLLRCHPGTAGGYDPVPTPKAL